MNEVTQIKLITLFLLALGVDLDDLCYWEKAPTLLERAQRHHEPRRIYMNGHLVVVDGGWLGDHDRE